MSRLSDSPTVAPPTQLAGTEPRVLQDRQNCLPLRSVLSRTDLVLLMTPVIPASDRSEETADIDPFEPLGQALSQHHPIRHVPYNKSDGVTGVHVSFIKRVKAVICVLTGLSEDEGESQHRIGAIVGHLCEARPLVILACCSVSDETLHIRDFPTVITFPSISRNNLESISFILTQGSRTTSSLPESVQSETTSGTSWSVEEWKVDRDAAEVHALWLATVPQQFRLDRSTLDGLLARDGWSRHLVVRDSRRQELLGFCATYTTFADSGGDNLVYSIAAILVREEYRGRGIGTSLHNEALGRVHQTRGISRIQLGTTFPRLLHGIPIDLSANAWFKKRGWLINEGAPGQGRLSADWVLRFTNIPTVNLASAGLSFRPCEITDFQQVLKMTGKESDKKLNFGWYDQFARTLDSAHMEDIVLGFEGTTLAVAAITYVPNSGSIPAADIPWPSTFGPDIGGVTCICFNDDDPEVVNRRDTVMVRLLHACARLLADRGMVGLFVDSMKPSDYYLEALGFRKWAEYHEVWRPL